MVLEIRMSCNQREGSACTHSVPKVFFLFWRGWGEGPCGFLVLGKEEVDWFQYWPSFIGSKRTMLGKLYGTKWGANWEHVGNPLGKLIGTTKIPKMHPHPQQPLLTLPKRKKIGPPWVHAGSPNWPPRISMPTCALYHIRSRANGRGIDSGTTVLDYSHC